MCVCVCHVTSNLVSQNSVAVFISRNSVRPGWLQVQRHKTPVCLSWGKDKGTQGRKQITLQIVFLPAHTSVERGYTVCAWSNWEWRMQSRLSRGQTARIVSGFHCVCFPPGEIPAPLPPKRSGGCADRHNIHIMDVLVGIADADGSDGGNEDGWVTWQEWRETQCSKSAILVNKSFVCSFNISEFVFIVAFFINKNNKTMNHNAFVLKERKYLIQRK